MTFALPDGRFERPGAYVNEALIERPDIIDRAVRLIMRYPQPIPSEFIPMCEGVTNYAILECADTPDADANRAAHMRGLQWAYALAEVSSLVKPTHLAIKPLGARLDRTDMYTNFNLGVETYDVFCPEAGRVADECVPLIDLLGKYPRLTRRGLLSGLYMADLGMQQLRDYGVRLELIEYRERIDAQLDGILGATEQREHDEAMSRKKAEFNLFRQFMERGGFPDPEL